MSISAYIHVVDNNQHWFLMTTASQNDCSCVYDKGASPSHNNIHFFMCYRLLQADQFYGRGDMLPPPPSNQFRRDHQSQDCHEPDQIQLLQSISMTLSDMQRQLATIQEQNVHRDDTLRRLENDMQKSSRSS